MAATYNRPFGFVHSAIKVILILILITVAAAAIGTALGVVDVPAWLMAKDPNNIIIPEPHPDAPKVVPHIKNHPRGEFTARLKEAFWNVIFSLWLGGQPPDWCGRRASDNAFMVVYYAAKVVALSGKEYIGGALILNQGGEHLSTVLSKVKPKSDGSPDSENSRGNDGDLFVEETCPDSPGSLLPITQ